MYTLCSTFENNIGNTGIFTVTHLPLLFNGTTKFIGNTGTVLKVKYYQFNQSVRLTHNNIANIASHAFIMDFVIDFWLLEE